MPTGPDPNDAAALLQAYRRTAYQVLRSGADGEVEAVARIGEHRPSIDALLLAHGAVSGVFITAWNPRSQPRPRPANQAAHTRLLAELDRLGCRHLPHRGAGPDPGWDPEEGLFVLDVPLPVAVALARSYRQNAVVFVTAGEPARLVLTELLPADVR